MIGLTTLPAPELPTDVVSAIHAYDLLSPDGLTKEIIARVAALAMVNANDAASLVDLHDLLESTVAQAVASGAGVVNPVVKRIVFLDALHVSPGQPESDATAALAGAIYDIVNKKLLTITAVIQPPVAASLFGTAAAATPDLSALDLLSPECEVLRQVLTRTLMTICPDVYAKYREAKDSGAANAREKAYGYVFGLLATRITETKKQGGF